MELAAAVAAWSVSEPELARSVAEYQSHYSRKPEGRLKSKRRAKGDRCSGSAINSDTTNQGTLKITRTRMLILVMPRVGLDLVLWISSCLWRRCSHVQHSTGKRGGTGAR